MKEQLRQQLLNEVVLRGEGRKWAEAKTRVEWLDVLPGNGYRIKRLRYEVVPGLWIPALLYEPAKLTGKVPVILNTNGHEGTGVANDYIQIRCINEAKKGALALNFEWLGMGQLKTDGFSHTDPTNWTWWEPAVLRCTTFRRSADSTSFWLIRTPTLRVSR